MDQDVKHHALLSANAMSQEESLLENNVLSVSETKDTMDQFVSTTAEPMKTGLMKTVSVNPDTEKINLGFALISADHSKNGLEDAHAEKIAEELTVNAKFAQTIQDPALVKLVLAIKTIIGTL